MKSGPDFRECFGCIEDSRNFSRDFFNRYSEEHKHFVIAWLTPGDVHYGKANEVVFKRQILMDAVYKKNPERFVKGVKTIKKPDTEVWINKPQTNDAA